MTPLHPECYCDALPKELKPWFTCNACTTSIIEEKNRLVKEEWKYTSYPKEEVM